MALYNILFGCIAFTCLKAISLYSADLLRISYS